MTARIQSVWNTFRRLSFSDVKASSQGQNFGLGLDKLASASSIWPRPGLGLVNLASKMCYPQCKIILVVSILWLYRCNIHYKDVVNSLMWDTNSFMCYWHFHCVFLFRNICMWLASALALTSSTWPQPCPQVLGLSLVLEYFASALS